MSEQGVPAHMLARLLDLDEAQLRTLARRRIIPAAANGRYPLVEAVQGYIRHLRQGSISRYATSQEIASIYGFSQQRFQQLRAQGAFPDPQPGIGFDRDACARQYVRFLLQREQAPLGASEELRKIKAERERLRLGAESGDLVSKRDVIDSIRECAAVLVQHLEALAGRLAPELAEEADVARCRRILLEGIRDARKRAARALSGLGGEHLGDGTGRQKTAPAVRMGGRRASPA